MSPVDEEGVKGAKREKVTHIGGFEGLEMAVVDR
jgi:hypothetical protein